jgi:uncharacterized protein (UPF0371 family)
VPETLGRNAVLRFGGSQLSILVLVIAANPMSAGRIATGKQTRLASLREKDARLVQAINESRDVENRLLLKGRSKEAEIQELQTAYLRQKQGRLRMEIRDLS